MVMAGDGQAARHVHPDPRPVRQEGREGHGRHAGGLPPLPKDAPPTGWRWRGGSSSPEHPLTARVAVNRFWQMFFGTGLVKTAEDFGSQGERPSHPELLDWLAVEFRRDRGWDVKAMSRLIVTSATYRQSSAVTPDRLAKDPENRLLARGPRLRLPAEFIRDQALAVERPARTARSAARASRRTSRRACGRSWRRGRRQELDGPDVHAEPRRATSTAGRCTPSGSGPARRRRSSTFDAPTARPAPSAGPTNTPLQALVLMNDPTYVEASRKLAERMMTEGGKTADERITFAFRLVLARPPARPGTGCAREDAQRGRPRQVRGRYGGGDEAAGRRRIAAGREARRGRAGGVDARWRG